MQIKNLYQNNKILLIILAGAFLASLAYSFYFRITLAVDALAYDVIAQNITSGAGFREDISRDLTADSAITRVGPLYEYFLAGIYKVFGHHYEAVWLAQAGLHALSAWLVYLIVLLIFIDHDKKKKIGLLAAAILGFYPDLIEISAMLMTETFYLFLTCLLVYVFFAFIWRPGVYLAAVLGLSTGLAVLARPPVLFLVPVMLFYFWQKKLWRQAILFLCVLAVVFIPWTYRNYQIYDQVMPFGAAGNFNFWIGNQHGGDGEQGLTEEHMQFLSSHEAREVNGESMKQFKSFLLNHPLEFVKLTWLRINKYFSVIRPMGFWFYQQGLGQLFFLLSSAAASVFLFVFSLGGILKAIASRDKRLYYLLALTIFTPLIIFITVVETRYRFQIYPLLAIFAGYFIVNLQFGQTKWRREKTLWLAVALVFSNGIIDSLLSLARLKERLGWFF
ncbi:MAG: glycosyltransferase family 39 protein [bacterium]|nr:glycosyltransferase family 39 protein [bacterium]